MKNDPGNERSDYTHHQHSKVIMMAAVNGGRVSPRVGDVTALCPPAAVSIQQVKIPVGCGRVYTQREVPESDGHGAQCAPAAAAWRKTRSKHRKTR